MKISSARLKPKGKLFFSVLGTYLLLLVVVLSLLITGYVYSLHQSIQDQETLQITFLQQIRKELDFRFSSVFRINNYLTSYPLTLSISQYEEDLPEYQMDYQRLNEILVQQNELIQGEGQTILYFDKSDSLLTGNSRYRSVNLDAFTVQLGFTPAEFRDFLKLENLYGELRVLNSGTERGELIYLQPILDDSFQRLGIVMTRLSMSYLREAISVSRWMEGSICHMVGGDESIYIESGGYGVEELSSSSLNYDEISLQAEPVYTNLDGEDFVTVGLRSSNNTWSYYFSVPVRNFYRNSTIYCVLFSIALGIGLALGVVLAMLFSNRFSKPLSQILHTLYLNPDVNFPNAIQSIESAFTTYQENLVSTQNLLHRSTYYGKNRFLYALCRGTLTPKQIDRDLEKYHIPLEKNQPVTLILCIYHKTDQSVFFQDGVLNNEMLLYASWNILGELLQGVVGCQEMEALCIRHTLENTGDEFRTSLKKLRIFIGKF